MVKIAIDSRKKVMRDKLTSLEDYLFLKPWFKNILETIEYNNKNIDFHKFFHLLINFYNNKIKDNDEIKKYNDSQDKNKLFTESFMILISEIILDLQSSYLLCQSGYYKQANANLRNILENFTRILIFLESPSKIEGFEDTKNSDYYTYNTIKINFYKKLDKKFKNQTSFHIKALNLKNNLSSYVHTFSQNFSQKLFPNPKFDSQKFNDWIINCNEVYHFMELVIYTYYFSP